MNCYDCHASEGADTAAVAVCHGCNSGLCPGHLRITRPVVHRVNGTGVSHSPAPARQVLCATCHAAAQGIALPSPSAERSERTERAERTARRSPVT
ncbi:MULTISPECIES: DUF2180 family protein [Streptomyces]|uniref:DUF2180 family protein n=1 Tax=Streptomyces nondiastaticus TaxID=3154512 RepID=A0ABW6TV27_9ACTN|nr:DUF2180 family protein [Streptomyces sp. VNUA116]WKU47652.1 DUF2180 family protein [Streptomyces sp. VNUA116]